VRVNAQALGSLVWLGFATFLIWAGRDLGVGQPSEPGAGFLIFWGGILIAAVAAWTMVESIRGPAETLGSLWAETRWGKVVVVVVALLLYGASLSTLGFLLATPPLLLVLFRAVDPVGWAMAIAVALGSTLGVWWVLERLLSIRLPGGILS
jgi:putative tricarboxylic transport membrane protein